MSNNNLDIPRIIPATINLIEDNATEMYVTDNNFGDNFKVLNKIPPQGQFNATKNSVISNYSNLNLEFWLNQCGDDVVYDTNRSCLVLRNKFNLNITACTATNAALNPVLNTTNGTLSMGPGKLIFKEGMWWYARCKLTPTTTAATTAETTATAGTPPTYTTNATTNLTTTYNYDYDHFEEPVAISLAPLNACAPIEQTQVYFSGINSQDNNKNFTTCFFQNALSKEYQESSSDTWFGGNVREWDCTTVDYATAYNSVSANDTAAGLYSSGSGNKGQHYDGTTNAVFVFYMDTSIPLCLLNQMFDNHGGPHVIPKIVRGANEALRILIRCLPVSAAKLWGNTTIFNQNLTGVCGAFINLFTISQAAVSSDSNNGSWSSYTWKVMAEPQSAQQISENGNLQLTVGQLSVNHVCVLAQQRDEGSDKSTYYKQRFTFLQWDGILNYYNHKNPLLQNMCAVGFYNVELQRKSSYDKVFSARVDTLEDQYRMFLETYGIKSQYREGVSPHVETLQKWLCNSYGLYYNLQNFSYLDVDVIQDGFDSFTQRMQFLYSLGLHNQGSPAQGGKIVGDDAKRDNNDYPKIGNDNKGNVATTNTWTITLMSTHDQYLYYYHGEKRAVLTDRPSDFAQIQQ